MRLIEQKESVEIGVKSNSLVWIVFPVMIVILGIFLAINSCQIFVPSLDIVIRNGQIVDGTGNPLYLADLGVKDGKIVEIGILETRKSKKMIDAKDLYVVPGFIDLHTHVDRKIDSHPTVMNYLRQGVTTVIGGNCGGSRYPLQEFLSQLEERRIAINFRFINRT